MEGRFHSALYIIQISLLLLVGGCGSKKEASPTLPEREEEKVGVAIQEAHLVQSDAQGRKILEIWANSSEGEEKRLFLKGIGCLLYEKGEPFAELSAPSAIYQPEEGVLFFNKGANLKDLGRERNIICDSLQLLFKEKRIRGKGIHIKWGDMILEGKELLADWGLNKGMLKRDAIVKINLKRRTK